MKVQIRRSEDILKLVTICLVVTPETRVKDMAEELFEDRMAGGVGEPKLSPQTLQTQQHLCWEEGGRALPVPRGKSEAECRTKCYSNCFLFPHIC